MSERDGCAEVRDLIPELAMGVAPGDLRATALAHLAHCDACRAELRDATALVDDLLLTAPEHEPPVGFESRVLAAARVPVRRRRRAPLLVAAAVAVLASAAGAAGVVRSLDADDRELAAQYRDTLATADGSYLRAADLTDGTGTEVGNVFAYQGRPSWLFLTVDGVPEGEYDVRVVGTDGVARVVGTCRVEDGRGSWGTAIDLPVHSVGRVELRYPDGPAYAAVLRDQ